jgi:hypothetical protein
MFVTAWTMDRSLIDPRTVQNLQAILYLDQQHFDMTTPIARLHPPG